MKFEGTKLRTARKRRKFSAMDLCIEISRMGDRLTPQTICAHEKNITVPNANTLANYSLALGFPVGYFFKNISK
jgi:hypothetical protein